MKPVKACVCAENNLQRRFHPQGGAVKYVQACSRACKYGESSFHYYGSHVKLVKPVYVQETPYNDVLTAEVVL